MGPSRGRRLQGCGWDGDGDPYQMASREDEVFPILLDRWRAGSATELELFVALRDPMRHGARRGIRGILSEQPDEHDVDEAVERAFTQLIDKGPSEVRSNLRGTAAAFAFNRGRDRARWLIRERERIRNAAWQAELISPTGAEADDHEKRERLLDALTGCIEGLNALEREVIDVVFSQLVPLSDWTAKRGKSYESGRKVRSRALMKLRACIESFVGPKGGI